MKHQYCPVCGHQLTGIVDYSFTTRKLLSKRSEYTQTRIRKLFTLIQKENSNEITSLNTYRFMKKLEQVKDDVIKKVIDEFIVGEYHKKLYGLSYIIGWIDRLNNVYDKKKIVEKKIYGSSPPERSI